MSGMWRLMATAAVTAALIPTAASAQQRPDQQTFFNLYKELILSLIHI